MGYGKVVAFYTPEGKTIRAYELRELFTQDVALSPGFQLGQAGVY
jgi:hypothetical protein